MNTKISKRIRAAALFALCACIAPMYAHAKGPVDCRQLNEAVGGPGDDFRPPVSATVIGSGRAYFHSAPDAQCVTKRTFIIPGDSVTVYKPYKGWYQIMYVNSKTGEDFEGWVEKGRLSLGGTLGGGQ
ncbi:hypothetical protein WM32_09900 [Burkholderia ubonensis]|uniref:hypothetical protein n=1 Tax=Burkholderia ubonensis TaxID=101571 RepID=UPI00075200F4|nr:hypothetical protein [Burkholderia ubonensis]KWO87986.1 hypothetical protein WM32_09900 [Burkholderia ubonensis]